MVPDQRQQGLPEAAKEFKKIYPEGDFDVDIHIKVTSNKKEQAPEELKPAVDPAAKDKPPVEKSDSAK